MSETNVIRIDMASLDHRAMKLRIHGEDAAAFLDDAAKELWDAASVIKSVAQALEAHFGSDWPSAHPDYRRALRVAADKVEAVSGGLIEIDCEEPCAAESATGD